MSWFISFKLLLCAFRFSSDGLATSQCPVRQVNINERLKLNVIIRNEIFVLGPVTLLLFHVPADCIANLLLQNKNNECSGHYRHQNGEINSHEWSNTDPITENHISLLFSFTIFFILCLNSQWSDNARNEKPNKNNIFFVIFIYGFLLIGNTIPIIILHFNYLFDKFVFVYQIRFFRISTTTKIQNTRAVWIRSSNISLSLVHVICQLFDCVSLVFRQIIWNRQQKCVLLFSLNWFNWP